MHGLQPHSQATFFISTREVSLALSLCWCRTGDDALCERTITVYKSTGTCTEVNKSLVNFPSLLSRRTFGTVHLSATY